jgi:hypothetical protein
MWLNVASIEHPYIVFTIEWIWHSTSCLCICDKYYPLLGTFTEMTHLGDFKHSFTMV